MVLFFYHKISVIEATVPKIEQHQQHQKRVGAFNSLITILRQVSPLYFSSDFSLLTLCFIIVLLSLGYVLYGYLPKHKLKPQHSIINISRGWVRLININLFYDKCCLPTFFQMYHF